VVRPVSQSVLHSGSRLRIGPAAAPFARLAGGPPPTRRAVGRPPPLVALDEPALLQKR
jgi:hypothetical protein